MDRMTAERHAEIVDADRRAETTRGFIAGPRSPIFHRRELLLELAEVTRELAELEDLGTEAFVDRLMEKARLRNLEIRAGHFELDLTQVEELASAYVAFARTLLGDAENYSETPLNFHVKVAEEPQKYILTVQRTGPGKLTPHQARQRAEAERDGALARVAELERELAKDARWQPEDEGYEVLLNHPIWGSAVIYDECDTLAAVSGLAARAFAEMEADELEPGPVFTRRITRQFRQEQP